MNLPSFIAKNAFRNKRRSLLTVLSISFSLLLLTMLISIWRGFYLDEPSPDAALRIITRHRVSLAFMMPIFYREKIRAIPGVLQVVPMNWFGGKYKDDKPENMFAQFGTDPEEVFKVHRDWKVEPEQLAAWQRDRAGAAVERKLADKHLWKLGDRIVLIGNIYAVNAELTVRAIFDADEAWQALLFNQTYVEEAVPYAKGRAGIFAMLVDSPDAVARISGQIDEMFKNAPQPTKTESEKAFQLGFVAMLGNVKAFILSIGLAVVFAILLVSANTMAMSIRERTREVALLKTLGFTRGSILSMFVGESVMLAVFGGLLGAFCARWLLSAAASSPAMGGFLAGAKVTAPTLIVSLLVAALVGLLSAFVPSYHASKLKIVDGLRHIG
ncbi:MAG: ABC transporter permease [Acidobacteria bacterium]|nr:ABC transporter permease [Acidobacteriota bacterium]